MLTNATGRSFGAPVLPGGLLLLLLLLVGVADCVISSGTIRDSGMFWLTYARQGCRTARRFPIYKDAHTMHNVVGDDDEGAGGRGWGASDKVAAAIIAAAQASSGTEFEGGWPAGYAGAEEGEGGGGEGGSAEGEHLLRNDLSRAYMFGALDIVSGVFRDRLQEANRAAAEAKGGEGKGEGEGADAAFRRVRARFELFRRFVVAEGSLLGDMVGNRRLLDVHRTVPFLRSALATDGHGVGVGEHALHEGDAAVLRRALPASMAECAGLDDLCLCSFVGCAWVPAVGGVARGGGGGQAASAAAGAAAPPLLRVVAVSVESLEREGGDAQTIRSLAALPALETLVYGPKWWAGDARAGAGTAAAEAVCSALELLAPRLRRLAIGGVLPPRCALPALQSLAVSMSYVESRAGDSRPDRPHQHRGRHYAWACNSPRLLSLSVDRASSAPACLGTSNTALLRLDLRGGTLGTEFEKEGEEEEGEEEEETDARGGDAVAVEPLPAALSGLSNLVDFVAFEQNLRACPPADHEARARAAGTGPCQPSYLWKGMQVRPLANY